MILTQKPIAPHFALSPATHHHRRHPSAPPAVVVQPTRTPGLLSLSKPVVHAQRPVKAQPKKQLPAALPAAATTTAAVSVVTSSASRGRSQDKPKSKPKDKQPATARSSSRRGHRQPSPPINTSSQAEDPPLPPAPIPIPKVRTAPTLTEKPSGKLAKRRQQHQPHAPQQFLSKSVPVTSHLPRTLSDTTFPICDDMTDLSRPITPENQPVTPTRPRSKRAPASHINLPAASAFFDDGPKTAPLSSTSGPSLFPFPVTTSPFSSPRKSNQRSNRRHKRSPSEGVFLMSSSEESDSSASKSLIKRHSATSFTPPRKRVSTIQGGGSRPLNLPMTEEEKEAYFASSSFQNSPSPEDLPPPDF